MLININLVELINLVQIKSTAIGLFLFTELFVPLFNLLLTIIMTFVKKSGFRSSLSKLNFYFFPKEIEFLQVLHSKLSHLSVFENYKSLSSHFLVVLIFVYIDVNYFPIRAGQLVQTHSHFFDLYFLI